MRVFEFASGVLFLVQTAYAIAPGFGHKDRRGAPLTPKLVKLSARDAPPSNASAAPPPPSPSPPPDLPPPVAPEDAFTSSNIQGYYDTSNYNCTAMLEYHHYWVATTMWHLKDDDARNKTPVNGQAWGAESIRRFDANSVYSRLTVFTGRVENFTIPAPDKTPVLGKRSDAPDYPSWADGKAHSVGMMSTFQCNSSITDGGYYRGVQGRAVYGMFHMLYDQAQMDTCGGANFDNGCSLSIDFCLDGDCVDTPGGPSLATGIADSAVAAAQCAPTPAPPPAYGDEGNDYGAFDDSLPVDDGTAAGDGAGQDFSGNAVDDGSASEGDNPDSSGTENDTSDDPTAAASDTPDDSSDNGYGDPSSDSSSNVDPSLDSGTGDTADPPTTPLDDGSDPAAATPDPNASFDSGMPDDNFSTPPGDTGGPATPLPTQTPSSPPLANDQVDGPATSTPAGGDGGDAFPTPDPTDASLPPAAFSPAASATPKIKRRFWPIEQLV